MSKATKKSVEVQAPVQQEELTVPDVSTVVAAKVRKQRSDKGQLRGPRVPKVPTV